MILEELKTIKSFGSQLESTVTPEDIAAKEKKLKITLPEPLKDLYLTFHPEDPLFSGPCSLIPLEELKLQRIRKTYWHFVLLPFAQEKAEQQTLSAGIEMKASPKNKFSTDVYRYQERADPPAFRGSNMLGSGMTLSAYIIEWLAVQQIYAMPSILGVQESCHFLPSSPLHTLPCLYQLVESVRLPEEGPPVFLATDSTCRSCPRPDEFAPQASWDHDSSKIIRHAVTLIGARSDEPLEELLERTGLEPRWQRSQNGHDIYTYQPPEQKPRPEPFRPKEERELLSIAPVLDFLRRFAGADGPCATEESLARAEARLGGALPLPLREYYQYMPKACYRGQNYLTPPGNLRPRKDGKVTFLTENQWCCYWGAARGSCYLFEREEDKSPWEPVGILDGYLVWEFILDLTCSGTLKIEMSRYPDFKLDMLEEGGALCPYLSDIAGITEQIAVGNFLRMYQGLDGRLVAVCENQTPELYLFARDDQTIEEFCNLAKSQI